ncbi:MAG: hydrogenase iron-sulfur subunit [Thermoplasmata archaeon]|nr:MAG: hydrogenase iron-sulfur subunit [Thermoplasmata archaeon]
MSDFEPEIVAMCCNWCSYAGADLAGVSRVQYPPNVRILRVMCSGRVEVGHIVRAMEMGADGLLVTGCHIGDCHYISGNEQAQEAITAAKETLSVLGMEDRVALEWISAAEGQRFGQVMTDFVEHIRALGPNPMRDAKVARGRPGEVPGELADLVDKTGVLYCLECGKCEATCPITRMEIAYSPMLIVEEALRDLPEELEADKGLWNCITCGLCSHRCPSGVDFLEFVRQAREVEPSACDRCAHGGVFHSLAGIMANEAVDQPGRLAWVDDDIQVAEKGDTLYFTGCLPYFESVLWDVDVHPQGALKSTVRVLNAAGITPVVMADERCCGHDLVWSGQSGTAFAELARLNVEAIKRTGAKRVVFTCPEGLRTFAIDYPRVLGEDAIDFELLHMTQLFAQLIEEGTLEMPEGPDDKVPLTIQDPCRLGRHMGEVDAPRKVLTSLPGYELKEMEHHGLNSHCCGTSSWLNCGTFSKRIQLERMEEAVASGADLMVTACPKCFSHFNCTLNEPGSEDLPPKPAVEIVDISVLLSKTLGLEGGDM